MSDTEKKEVAKDTKDQLINVDGELEVTKDALVGAWLVIGSVVIDTLGASVVQPILPYYAKKFDADGTKLGFLYSSFAIMSLISTYVMSTLSDRVGRRACILFSLIGSLTGFIAMALVTNYTQLLLARIYCGSTSGSYTVAQAYIADAIPQSQRGKYFSYLGASVVLMYVIGPLLGGSLVTVANDDYTVPYYFSAIIAALGFTFAFFKLKEVQVDDEEDEDDETQQHDTSVPGVVYVVGLIGLFHGCAFSVFGSMGALFLLEKFKMGPLELGLVVMSGAFVLSSVIFFGFAPISKRFGNFYTAATGSTLVTVACFAIGSYGDTETWKWFTLVTLPLIFFGGNALFNPAFPSINAQFSHHGNRGKVLATGSSIREASSVIAPIIFGILYDQDKNYPWFAGGALCGCAILPMIYLGMQDAAAKAAKKKDLVEEVHDLEEITYLNAPAFSGTEKMELDDKAYIKLGKDFGEVLGRHNMPWVYTKPYSDIMSFIDHTMITMPKWVLADKSKDALGAWAKYIKANYTAPVQAMIHDLDEHIETDLHEAQYKHVTDWIKTGH